MEILIFQCPTIEISSSGRRGGGAWVSELPVHGYPLWLYKSNTHRFDRHGWPNVESASTFCTYLNHEGACIKRQTTTKCVQISREEDVSSAPLSSSNTFRVPFPYLRHESLSLVVCHANIPADIPFSRTYFNITVCTACGIRRARDAAVLYAFGGPLRQ